MTSPPGGIGATAGWMLNLGSAFNTDDELAGVRLDDAAVQQWFSVVADVLQANDPLQLPLYVEAAADAEQLVLTPAVASACAAETPTCLVLTGVVAGDLGGSGVAPRAVELYAACEVADLGEYGLGVANDGGGSDGEELALSGGPVAAGSFFYVASEAVFFASFFGFPPDATSAALLSSLNGNDAVELFRGGAVVDVFGRSGGGASGADLAGWSYAAGWAARNNGTAPCSSRRGGESCRWEADGLASGWTVRASVLPPPPTDGGAAPATNGAAGDGMFPVGAYRRYGWDPCTCDDLPCEKEHAAGTVDPDLYRCVASALRCVAVPPAAAGRFRLE